MTKVRMIVWDMDGTIADLYGVDGWLEMLRAENPLPYEMAEPMWDMERLANIIRGLQDFGIEQRIVSWLSMGSSEEYKTEVRRTKREWLDEFDFPYDSFHGVQFGATKADSVRRFLADDETAILIDDSAKVRKGWHLGETVDPTETDVIDFLETLLESLIEE
jgi:phosphoglycolate phosphatase-like HAD superfamily hydrolase